MDTQLRFNVNGCIHLKRQEVHWFEVAEYSEAEGEGERWRETAGEGERDLIYHLRISVKRKFLNPVKKQKNVCYKQLH